MAENEPTRKLAGSENASSENEILRVDTGDSPSTLLHPGTSEPDPNLIYPNRVRFILLCLSFAFVAGWIGVNSYNLSRQKSALPEIGIGWNGERYVIIGFDEFLSSRLANRDQIEAINGETIDARYKFFSVLRPIEPGQSYEMVLRRGDELFRLPLTAEPVPWAHQASNILLGTVTPLVFLFTGIFVFLFKPNDRLVLLIASAFSLIAMSMSPVNFIAFAESGTFLTTYWQLGYFLSMLYPPLLLHFFLLFPQPMPLLRRFPVIAALIYLPIVLYVLPVEIGMQAAYNGSRYFEQLVGPYKGYIDSLYAPYLLMCFLVLAYNYRASDLLGRRRIRVLLAGVALAVAGPIIADFVVPAVQLFLDVNPFRMDYSRDLFTSALAILAPPMFAYAVIRHRVIPISFIVRRGLQYIFAKNGIRILMLFPVGLMLWNVISVPDRTVSDLVFRNTWGFYIAAASAIIFALLLRTRLNEWIDRRFFREEFDRELLLRNMIDDIKDCDSLIKLSRLVTSQIQQAFHPASVYLFYEDKTSSSFSLGYSTSSASAEMKLSAASPLLRYMQNSRYAVEFPLKEADGMSRREWEWLESIEANLLVPMHGTDGKLAGFLSLGEKRSEIPYTGRDKELLETIANQIALVQENLMLRDRMLRDQKIRAEVLSRFDAGNINLLKECPRCGRCFDRNDDRCPDDNEELTFTVPVEREVDGRYRLERLLGKGGMGAVYLALDMRINRRVALKVLSGAMFGNRDAMRRFEREAQTAGKLNHPNIVTVFDYGVLSTEGAFLVMEYIDGSPLSKVVRQNGRLDRSVVIDWFGQVLDGVEAAHSAGIVHRDLKPDNILVATRAGDAAKIYILDFGLARFNESELFGSVTVPGTVVGTLGYMSPEQLQAQKIDERTDLFSVGVMIYECLNGGRPFAGRTFMDIVRSMKEFDLHVAAAGDREFFHKSLALDPHQRFQTARAMRSALGRLTSNDD